MKEKVAAGQARLVKWDDIKADPPPQLKISPIAAVPHKSKPYRSILDLSFSLKLTDGTHIPSVNNTTTKLAPHASTEQLGHSLSRLIHAFAESQPHEKVFMAKWDVKDGFWRLQCQAGEECSRTCYRKTTGSQQFSSSQHRFKWGGSNPPDISAPRQRQVEMWQPTIATHPSAPYHPTNSFLTPKVPQRCNHYQ